MRRVRGEPAPWSDDAVIAAYRFTNVYRASDRVSQYLIRHVQYSGSQEPIELFFRTLLFKLFNRIETWERLTAAVGEVTWRTFSVSRYMRVFDRLFASGEPIYSAAYIMPSPNLGEARKHANHLLLLERMLRDGAPSNVAGAENLATVFATLRAYPSLGDFLAFQFAIDINYSTLVDFSEMGFVVAGPGARDGIRKCFVDVDGLDDADVIRAVTDIADSEFDRLDLRFETLWGRPLQLIDCQNLFCEVDKYARVVHPAFSGASVRTRIKQRYVPSDRALPQWYPPKWDLHVPEYHRIATNISV